MFTPPRRHEAHEAVDEDKQELFLTPKTSSYMPDVVPIDPRLPLLPLPSPGRPYYGPFTSESKHINPAGGKYQPCRSTK